MKKLIPLLIGCIALALTLCACGTSSGSDADGITSDGKTVEITLAENPTTGYTWGYTIDVPNQLAFQTDIYSPNDSNDKNVGGGGMHTYTFTAIAPGTSTITFTERQNWEGGETGQIRTFTVKADDDLAITAVTAN